MIEWIAIAGLYVIACLAVKSNSNTYWEIRSLDTRFDDFVEVWPNYRETHVPKANSFLYAWDRAPGIEDNDYEILDWCIGHAGNGVTYAFKHDNHNQYSYPANSFKVWITDPKLAMEFKLRYH